MSTLTDTAQFRVYYLSEQAVTVEFGNTIDEGLLNKVNRFNDLLHQHPFAGFTTTVPAYATLTVFFDVMTVHRSVDLQGATCFDKVSCYLTELREKKSGQTQSKFDKITIPVCYGGDFGPDISEVAALNRLTVDEVIKLHFEAIYKVYMIGFVPGFAYLGGMNVKLASPRKETPRKVIPAGSVGIAGEQTGVYPLETPGGWQIIGRTPFKLFDADREKPSLLKAGDEVVFKPISFSEFTEYFNSHADQDH